jgi:hypothetical protein
MAGTTTNFGFDYPTSTDYVKDGATAIQALADDVDARFGNVATYPNQIVNVVSGVSRPVAYAMAAGTGVIPIPAALNTLSTVSVTFPASRFTQIPLVVMSPATTSVNARTTKIDGVTTSGFTAGQWQLSGGTLQSTTVYWQAFQMTSAASAG